jgi:LytS/YehU family sensor histidine kinase
MDENNLEFYCSNTLDQAALQHAKVGGLGLKNVKDRLNLIYGNQYFLEINEQSNEYQIYLRLPLKEKHETTSLHSS